LKNQKLAKIRARATRIDKAPGRTQKDEAPRGVNRRGFKVWIVEGKNNKAREPMPVAGLI